MSTRMIVVLFLWFSICSERMRKYGLILKLKLQSVNTEIATYEQFKITVELQTVISVHPSTTKPPNIRTPVTPSEYTYD